MCNPPRETTQIDRARSEGAADRDKSTPEPPTRQRSHHARLDAVPEAPGAPTKTPTVAPQLGPADLLPCALLPALSEQDKEYANAFAYVPNDLYDPLKHGEKRLVKCEYSGKEYYTGSRGMVHWIDRPGPAVEPPPRPPAPAPLSSPVSAALACEATKAALFGERGPEDDVWEVVDRPSLSAEGKEKLASSGYTDPSTCTLQELVELFERQSFLPPPPEETGSKFAGLSPEVFHKLSLYTRSKRQKALVPAPRFGDEYTTTAMLRVSAELAAEALSQGTKAHADKPTSMGMINFQQALAYVSMMTAPNGRAHMQLLNHAVGGVAPELPIEVTQDPRYVSVFYTFDQHAELDCEGTRMDTPVAEATKARMLELALPGTLSIKSCQGEPNSYVDEINAFCKEGTGGKIPEIVKELDPYCVAVLLCCVFLKVKWEIEGKRLPIDAFYPHPGSPLPPSMACATPLLTRQRYFGYKKTHFDTWTDGANGVTWLKLNCKPDEDTGDERFMLYALPDANDDDYKGSLFASMRLLSLDKFVSLKFTAVKLPCVSVATNKLDGKELLEQLGVSDIFYNVDSLPMMFWSPASDGGVTVSRIFHASCIKWNDEGAEAAAATLVEFACARRFELFFVRPHSRATRGTTLDRSSPSYRYRSLNAEDPELNFIMNRPGLALLCKAIPNEETHHLGSDCSRAHPRAGMLCEFFTLVEGHESGETPGSMGDFAKDDAPVGAPDEAFVSVDDMSEDESVSQFRSLGCAYDKAVCTDC